MLRKVRLMRCTSVYVVEELAQSNVERDSVKTEMDVLHADWLQELPEDLDVCIGQRDFEGAVDLVEKGRVLLSSYKGGVCQVVKKSSN